MQSIANRLQVGLTPTLTSKLCPDGGIGRHAGLRSQCFGVRVRVSLGAPINGSVAESGLLQQS